MRISLGDVSLWFDVSGPSVVPRGDTTAERPVLVAVDGGPGLDHMTVKPALGPLADDFQVLYFDLRGHGRSDRSSAGSWNMRTWAGDLRRLCYPLYSATPGWAEESGRFLARMIRNPDVAAHYSSHEASSFDPWSLLGAVRCPVLVLAGEDDPVCPLPVVEELVTRLPADTTRLIRLPGARHTIFRDRPDLAFPAVRNFVSQISENRPASRARAAEETRANTAPRAHADSKLPVHPPAVPGQEGWTTARQVPQTGAKPATAALLPIYRDTQARPRVHRTRPYGRQCSDRATVAQIGVQTASRLFRQT